MYISNVYKLSGRSVTVYTDTSASHEYLCTLIQNGHEFCKLFIKGPQTVMSKTWKIARKVYANQDHSVSAYIDTD